MASSSEPLRPPQTTVDLAKFISVCYDLAGSHMEDVAPLGSWFHSSVRCGAAGQKDPVQHGRDGSPQGDAHLGPPVAPVST